MPKGVYDRTPHVDDPALVTEVTRLYSDGMSQRAIGRQLGFSQNKVKKLMRRNNIATRPAHGVPILGPEHPNWRGDDASYEALHARVRVRRGRPQHCDRCGRCDDAVTYDWANLTGHYEDPDDYERMCRPCHRNYDNARITTSTGATA